METIIKDLILLGIGIVAAFAVRIGGKWVLK